MRRRFLRVSVIEQDSGRRNIMAAFEEIKEKVKAAAGDVVSEGRKLEAVAKLKYELFNVKNNNESLFKKLGKLYYAEKKLNDEGLVTDNSAEIILTCQKIAENEDTIASLEEKIKNAGAKNVCANCGKTLPENVKFCPYCGAEQNG